MPQSLRLCHQCPKAVTTFCPSYTNAKYCSEVCRNVDQFLHNTIWKSFQRLSPRPTLEYFRAIYFPVDYALPQFVGMRSKPGEGPGDLITDREHVRRYVPGSPSHGHMEFDCHREIGRQFDSNLQVWHDNAFLETQQKPNKYLAALLGKETPTFNQS
jgi:hypothetical protein